MHACLGSRAQPKPDLLAEDEDLPEYDSADEDVTDIEAVPTPVPPEQGK